MILSLILLMTWLLFSFLLKLNSHHTYTFTSPLQQTLKQDHRTAATLLASWNSSIQVVFKGVIGEWWEVMLLWWIFWIKFIKSFLKFSFLIFLFKRIPFKFIGKTVPFHSTDVTVFLLLVLLRKASLSTFFSYFLNKILKPKSKTLFSKFLKGYFALCL